LFPADGPAPGSLDDESIVRRVVTESIRKSAKSREQIAEEMSRLTGKRITVRMINGFTCESEELLRWPAQYTRAFCCVVNDWSLLHCLVERSGFLMITRDEASLLELGREYLRQKRASERVQSLEIRLAGFEL